MGLWKTGKEDTPATTANLNREKRLSGSGMRRPEIRKSPGPIDSGISSAATVDDHLVHWDDHAEDSALRTTGVVASASYATIAGVPAA